MEVLVPEQFTTKRKDKEMKRIFIVIGLLLLMGCSTNPEPISIEETLEESVLIRGMLVQLELQDSIITQLVETLAEQSELLVGFNELNQQQNQINSQVYTAIKLLGNR